MHNLNNVGDILERVTYELRGLPNVRAVRVNLRQALTEAYREVCELADWPWLRQRRPLLVMPDLTVANNRIARTSDRSFAVATAHLLEAAGATGDSDIGSVYLNALVGAEFGLDDVSLADDGDGNWKLGPFEVQKVYDSGAGIFIMACDPRMIIDSKTGDEGLFRFRFPRSLLAYDIDQVLGVYDKTTGRRLSQVPMADGIRNHNEDRAGQPTVYWLDDSFRVSTPHHTVLATATVPILPHRNAQAYGKRLLHPPRTTSPGSKFSPAGITFTPTNDATGALPAGTYRLFCTWTQAGRIGPRSEITEVVVASPHDCIEITGTPEVAEADIGKTLLWWYSLNDSPFYLFQDTASTAFVANPMSTIPYSAGTTYIKTWVDWTRDDSAIRWDELMGGADHRYISVWPRPTEPTWLELEAVVRPSALLDDLDVPMLPAPFLDLLVWMTVVKLAGVKHADEGTMNRARTMAAQRLSALHRRYGTHKDERVQRAVQGPVDAPRLVLPDVIDHLPD